MFLIHSVCFWLNLQCKLWCFCSISHCWFWFCYSGCLCWVFASFIALYFMYSTVYKLVSYEVYKAKESKKPYASTFLIKTENQSKERVYQSRRMLASFTIFSILSVNHIHSLRCVIICSFLHIYQPSVSPSFSLHKPRQTVAHKELSIIFPSLAITALLFSPPTKQNLS